MEFKREKKDVKLYAREVGFCAIRIHLILLSICFVFALGFSVGMIFFGISWFSKAGPFIIGFVGLLLGSIILYGKITNSIKQQFENIDEYVLLRIDYVEDGYFVLNNITQNKTISINVVDIKKIIKKKHTIIINTKGNNYIYFPKTDELVSFFNNTIKETKQI